VPHDPVRPVQTPLSEQASTHPCGPSNFPPKSVASSTAC